MKMKVKLFERTIEYENRADKVRYMLADIIEQVQNRQCYVHCFVVDDVEVYTDVSSYIIDRIDEVRVIEVVTMTKDEYVKYAAVTISTYIADTLPDVQKLADRFYEGVPSDTWQQFDRFLHMLQLINGAIDVVIEALNNESRSEWEAFQSRLKRVLDQLMEAMEAGDTVLIGDIIYYEMIELLKNIERKASDLEG